MPNYASEELSAFMRYVCMYFTVTVLMLGYNIGFIGSKESAAAMTRLDHLAFVFLTPAPFLLMAKSAVPPVDDIREHSTLLFRTAEFMVEYAMYAYVMNLCLCLGTMCWFGVEEDEGEDEDISSSSLRERLIIKV